MEGAFRIGVSRFQPRHNLLDAKMRGFSRHDFFVFPDDVDDFEVFSDFSLDEEVAVLSFEPLPEDSVVALVSLLVSLDDSDFSAFSAWGFRA